MARTKKARLAHQTICVDANIILDLVRADAPFPKELERIFPDDQPMDWPLMAYVSTVGVAEVLYVPGMTDDDESIQAALSRMKQISVTPGIALKSREIRRQLHAEDRTAISLWDSIHIASAIEINAFCLLTRDGRKKSGESAPLQLDGRFGPTRILNPASYLEAIGCEPTLLMPLVAGREGV